MSHSNSGRSFTLTTTIGSHVVFATYNELVFLPFQTGITSPQSDVQHNINLTITNIAATSLTIEEPTSTCNPHCSAVYQVTLVLMIVGNDSPLQTQTVIFYETTVGYTNNPSPLTYRASGAFSVWGRFLDNCYRDAHKTVRDELQLLPVTTFSGGSGMENAYFRSDR